MYSLLLWMPLRADCLAAVRTHFSQFILPVLVSQPDLVAAQLLSGLDTDQCLLVSVWHSKAALQRAESSGSLQAAFQQLAPYFARQPMMVSCEVNSAYFESGAW